MRRDLNALAGQTFDLLVIGGGIFGAGVARDAALRGLSVALVDKADFASGTSSRSSKLIHGGFRYLEQYAFGLVAEACRERRVLQEIAPHLVKPLPFLLPVYEGDPRSLTKMRLGMTLYDVVALYRNTEPHRTLKPDAAAAQEPALARDGLLGAIRYYDCQEDDARFCIDNLIHAAELGAACENYCELTNFETRDGRVVHATVKDRLGGAEFTIRAKTYVNAAGPWVERVANLGPAPETPVRLGPTKGVHILLPRLTRSHAIAFQARQDGRIMFVLPWHDCSLVGTTDTDFAGDPDDVRADEADVAYLLAATHALLPETTASAADVITTFAGLRPLLHSDARAPSSRSREHAIVRQGENLLSVAGGKYTTYRAVSESVVDEVYGLLGSRPARCRTAVTPIPRHRPSPGGARLADCPDVYESDVTHACANEMAMTVEDVMRRRTDLALSRFSGPDVAARVARVGGLEASLGDYVEQWRRAKPGARGEADTK